MRLLKSTRTVSTAPILASRPQGKLLFELIWRRLKQITIKIGMVSIRDFKQFQFYIFQMLPHGLLGCFAISA